MQKIVFLKEDYGLEEIRSRKSKRKQGAWKFVRVFMIISKTLGVIISRKRHWPCRCPVVAHILDEGNHEVALLSSPTNLLSRALLSEGICSLIDCHHPDTMITGCKVPFLSYGSFCTEKKIYGNMKLFESKTMLYQDRACSYYTIVIKLKSKPCILTTQ